MKVELARAFGELLTVKKRYKLFYGGRAGGKSFAFADALLTRAVAKKVLIACVREVQNSIKDSVYKLISDRISAYGLEGEFRLYEDRIVNVRNGSKFIFKGIMEHNAQNIKSLEGVDICWVEEGQKISFRAWEVLDPTIRKEGAEIWISMNREEEADPVWKALALKQDEDTIVRKVNYYDNPYCPEEMKKLALKTKVNDLDEYLHIWEGEPRREAQNKLIGRADVFRAMEAKIEVSAARLPLVAGLDVARFGDDKTAICLREGRRVIGFKTFSKLDVVEVAHQAAGVIAENGVVKMCIDVGGLGAGVYDVLIAEGFRDVAVPVNFGERAENPERFVNRRAEMWARMRDWLKATVPVFLPKFDGLVEDLTAPCVTYDATGRLQLEAKADIKKRIGRSTDVGDALALTFAIANQAFLFNLNGWKRSGFVDDNVYL